MQDAPDISSDRWQLAGREFTSRLLVGTGKYASDALMQAAISASGAEIVTVAVRRAPLAGTPPIDAVLGGNYVCLPNSAGCHTAEDAVRVLRLARAAQSEQALPLVKLEVISRHASLYPDMPETLKAAEILTGEGFHVMVYMNDDPVMAERLQRIGCAALMPLAAPIGSGLGIQNAGLIASILQNADVPVLIDAGLGTASDAAIAMELGCDGVLLNTAIAEAQDPVAMAHAMRHGVIAGRLAYQAGRMTKRLHASPSSPVTGKIT